MSRGPRLSMRSRRWGATGASLALHGLALAGLFQLSEGRLAPARMDQAPVELVWVSPVVSPLQASPPAPEQPARQVVQQAVVPEPPLARQRPVAASRAAMPARSEPAPPAVALEPVGEAVAQATSALHNGQEGSAPRAGHADAALSERPPALPRPSSPVEPASESHAGARPDYAYNPRPDYPIALREQGIAGVVWLRVWVDSEGRPGDIRLAKGSGYRLLDDAALRVVRHWRFIPARNGGQALASWVEFSIRFSLDG